MAACWLSTLPGRRRRWNKALGAPPASHRPCGTDGTAGSRAGYRNRWRWGNVITKGQVTLQIAGHQLARAWHVGGRLPFRPKGFDMKRVEIVPALVAIGQPFGINKEREPPTPGSPKAPRPPGQIGAGDLRKEVIGTAIAGARPLHTVRHPGQANQPGPGFPIKPDRDLAPQHHRVRRSRFAGSRACNPAFRLDLHRLRAPTLFVAIPSPTRGKE